MADRTDRETRLGVYEATRKLLAPALARVVSDPEFRSRLEASPIEALDELGLELDEATRAELEGRRFSEFWALRKRAAEGPVESRELPPAEELDDATLERVAGGGFVFENSASSPYAPPYVPVGPVPDRYNNPRGLGSVVASKKRGIGDG